MNVLKLVLEGLKAALDAGVVLIPGVDEKKLQTAIDGVIDLVESLIP